RDSERDVAPMVAAADAVILDTSEMGIEDAVAMAVGVIEKAKI
ncbi:MAG: (d)CMP kinase, partial [Marinosulfonomonas sp.]|nr:(d)CMP kinase [Marinosulfonomonas sp.]